MTKMNLLTVLCQFLLLSFDASAARSLITADIFEARGQRVCRAGKGRPCYKLAYFSELRRKLNFAEAELACRRDGGQLLSVESQSEQEVIEELVKELHPADGDFWIGLRRNHGDDSSSDCASQYYWLDGSKSAFRNWHWDEPSCGYEVCVVMYHQPSAPPGLGGLYMFQWNDDKCETKNNFICKYTAEQPADPTPPNSTQTEVVPSPAPPWDPNDQNRARSTAVNLVYVIIPTIPLILLLLTVTGLCCFKTLCRRTRTHQKSEVCQTDLGLGAGAGAGASPASADVYNVIRSQKDDDLVSGRPTTKNTSFLCSSPDTPTGDYDNLGGRDTESGFVTLASNESCFLNFELNELGLGRPGNREPYDRSLGRPGNREPYDRSLGRRTTRSEHYGGSGGAYGDGGLFDDSLRAARELQDAAARPGGRAGKVDLYHTYVSSGKQDAFHTSLGGYADRRSFHANLEGGRYFNEQDWIHRENY
ncbi:layilin isoform X2 [Cololabis saira]|uniref:layilin isoform X2 n=1 Tax=Cololabis saira TaxID=129043 RepID=UPI002AD47CD1|nr:layilin isoform X2 [Cololabis saira]